MNTSASEPVLLAEIERIQRERLAAVVLMTERMLNLAKAGEWDQVSDSERCRQALLKDCFESEVQPHNSRLFSEAIAAMLHMNEELMALLATARDEVSVRHTDQVYVRKSIGHYLDTESDSRSRSP